MEFTGSEDFKRFWAGLKNESPRGMAIAVAARFDEFLGALLGRRKGTLETKIDKALAAGLITPNESHDLHVIRDLRNEFGHEFAAADFDANRSARIESLITWQLISSGIRQYCRLYPTAQDRFLYVAGAFFKRLNRRLLAGVAPVEEPNLWDLTAFPATTNF